MTTGISRGLNYDCGPDLGASGSSWAPRSRYLPARALGVLGADAARWRRHARVPPRQHPPPRDLGRARRRAAATPRDSRRGARRGDLRAASRAGGIGRLDDGTQEHAERRVLFRRRAGLPAIRRAAPSDELRPGGAVVPARARRQDRHGHPAGRPPRRVVVEAGPARRASRHRAAGAILRRRPGRRGGHLVGRTPSNRGQRRGVRPVVRRAPARREPRGLVLSVEARLAVAAHLHVPEVDHLAG